MFSPFHFNINYEVYSFLAKAVSFKLFALDHSNHFTLFHRISVNCRAEIFFLIALNENRLCLFFLEWTKSGRGPSLIFFQWTICRDIIVVRLTKLSWIPHSLWLMSFNILCVSKVPDNISDKKGNSEREEMSGHVEDKPGDQLIFILLISKIDNLPHLKHINNGKINVFSEVGNIDNCKKDPYAYFHFCCAFLVFFVKQF